MAQIKSTIKMELEHSKQSWTDMIRTSGMRRRVVIAMMLGLFTQMSGNTLLSYYSNLLFELMGYTTKFAKTRINIANNCWSFMNATALALIITRFKRRHMFMISAASMLMVFISMTISFEKLREAKNAKTKNQAASIAALFFYFAYSPCYNMGNNALTYSTLPFPHPPKAKLPLTLHQPTSSNSSPTPSAAVVSESSRSSASSVASSPPTSTRSPSMLSTGSSSPSTAAGSSSSSPSFTGCTPRPKGVRSRNSLSVSFPAH